MSNSLHVLQNDIWQVGILPQTGASIAFGRVLHQGSWQDVLRPTAESDYNNPSNCSSFVLIPWSNRIRSGKFAFRGKSYQLEAKPPEGTASHGVGRNHPWTVESSDATHIRMRLDTADLETVNFPFAFVAYAEYRLEGKTFSMRLALENTDSQAFPAGFGQHPYFIRPDSGDVLLQVPCSQYFPLGDDHMPTGGAQPIPENIDHRTAKPLKPEVLINHVLTDYDHSQPIRITYPEMGLAFRFESDPIHKHVIVYTPLEQPHFAVEPVTNTNDGFNLFEQGIDGTGVFVLEPGETQSGTASLHLE